MTSTTRTNGTTYVTSADGTRIATSAVGRGPGLVLVDGALCSRAMGPSKGLAKALADRCTVWTYDRRGRGESGSGSSPYAVDREIEDLAAVVAAAGGRVHVFGSSSGGTLALEAAKRGMAFDRVVVYESPAIVDGSHPATEPEFVEQVQRLVDDGDRSGAVRAFMRNVGVPSAMLAVMRLTPVWHRLTLVAHTLPWDLSLVVPRSQGVPDAPGTWDDVHQPVLVLTGGKSPEYMRNAQSSLAAALPDGRLETLPGQTHMIKAGPTAPAVAAFLTA